MLTLALDTSTREGSIALARDGTLLGAATLAVRATHSETLLPAIHDLLTGADARAADLGAVVVGAGPGSFTGVRIGAALARGLCFPIEARLYAYSSLAALAAGASEPGRVCALLDARRGQVYAAGYDFGPSFGASFAEVCPPRAGALEDVLASLPPGGWRFVGRLGGELREAAQRAGAGLLPSDRLRPHALGLLWLFDHAPDRGEVAEPARWEPQYVRSSSAERRVGDG